LLDRDAVGPEGEGGGGHRRRQRGGRRGLRRRRGARGEESGQEEGKAELHRAGSETAWPRARNSRRRPRTIQTPSSEADSTRAEPTASPVFTIWPLTRARVEPFSVQVAER